MYSIHPTISHQLADARLEELRRISGHGRPYREPIHVRIRERHRR